VAFCRLDSCELDEGLRGRKFEDGVFGYSGKVVVPNIGIAGSHAMLFLSCRV